MKRFSLLILSLLICCALVLPVSAAEEYFSYTWDDTTTVANDLSLLYQKWGVTTMEIEKDDTGRQYLVIERKEGNPRLDFTQLDGIYEISAQYATTFTLNFESVTPVDISFNDGSNWFSPITFKANGDSKMDVTVHDVAANTHNAAATVDLNTWHTFTVHMDEDAKVVVVTMDGSELLRGVVPEKFGNAKRLLLSFNNSAEGTCVVKVDSWNMTSGEELTLAAAETQPAETQPIETQPVTQPVETQPSIPAAQPSAPATADVSVILAVAASVSAAGVMVLKKKRG